MRFMGNHPKAMAVAAIIFDLTCDEEFVTEAYLNGRESGFKFISADYRRAVVFSECRNSDSIVLYCGKSCDFSMQGNVPIEAVYNEKQFFGCEDYLGAAKAAVSYLIQAKEGTPCSYSPANAKSES